MSPARIVVIEDNPTEVHLLRHVLDEQGEAYELQVLRDGEEALLFVRNQRALAGEVEPCLILIDLHLPKYDGLEVLTAIKQEPVLAHIEVVILTTLASPREEAQIERLGALYRKKPANLTEYTTLAVDILAICRGASATTLSA